MNSNYLHMLASISHHLTIDEQGTAHQQVDSVLNINAIICCIFKITACHCHTLSRIYYRLNMPNRAKMAVVCLLFCIVTCTLILNVNVTVLSVQYHKDVDTGVKLVYGEKGAKQEVCMLNR